MRWLCAAIFARTFKHADRAGTRFLTDTSHTLLPRLRLGLALVAVGIGTTLVAVSQYTILKTGIASEHFVPRMWHKLITRLLGMRVHVEGRMSQDRPLLLAANHISWTDIMVIGGIANLHFVAKAEVGRWPLMGKLSRLQRTVFVERENRRASGEQASELGRRLAEGDVMLLYAEGSTSDGNVILPFKSTLFGAAQMAIAETDLERVTVQSVTIAYSRLHGMPMGRFHRRHTAWIGDRKLWPHIQAMLGEGGIDVEVRFGEPVEFTAATNRKEIARRLEGEVRSTMAAILHDPPVRK